MDRPRRPACRRRPAAGRTGRPAPPAAPAQDELKNRYLGGRGRDASLNKADGALQEILASSGYLSRPAELLDGDGYGLPQTREWTRTERESEQRQLRLNQLTEELDREVRVLLGDERREELEAIEVNWRR